MLKNTSSILLIVLSSSICAEIITDGTLGPRVELVAPDYQITPNLGQTVGPNLFHSFEQFNLSSGESATFSGSPEIQNVISRVTGGNPSHIDGILHSTLSHADLYFLNPYGILFGPNAKLDVQGGFHASTANYLRLGENGRFDVTHPEQSILSIASPTAFGFLEPPANIRVQGSQLALAPHTDFSLISGNLTLDHAKLAVSSGRINLVSVASSGEVTAKADRLNARIPNTSGFTQLGELQMTDTQIETSGSPSEGISIRGGQFWMNNSLIHAHNASSDAGKGIDIEISDSMSMRGDIPSELQPTAQGEVFGISSDTFGTGKAGDISITTPRLEMHQNTIDGSTKGEGEGGYINIQTQHMSLGEGAEILSNSYSAGAGGQINLKATEQLEMRDQRFFATEEEVDKNRNTVIQANSFGSGNSGHITIDTTHLGMTGSYIFSHNVAQGHGGMIIINSRLMELLNGSVISATVLPQGTGNGGEIKLNVNDTIKLSGFRPGFVREGPIILYNPQSGIGSSTIGLGNASLLEITTKNLILGYATIAAATVGPGDAGSMTITVDNLYLQDGGILTNSSGVFIAGELWFATGKGGHLTVTAKENIVIEGHSPFNPSSIATNTFLSGQGGNIDLQANRLIVRDEGTITANSLGTGNAGDIHIKANEIHLSTGGEITSAATQAVGGNIVVNASYLLNLRRGQITTSVHSGIGHGGDMSIENPTFIVLNQGQIKAQADEGQGGNIRLVADQFIATPDSLVSASSRLGTDGKVMISSPNETLSDNLFGLSTAFIDVSRFLPKPCETMSLEAYLNRSKFIVNPITGSAFSPNEFQPSRFHQTKTFTHPISPTQHQVSFTQQRISFMGCHL